MLGGFPLQSSSLHVHAMHNFSHCILSVNLRYRGTSPQVFELTWIRLWILKHLHTPIDSSLHSILAGYYDRTLEGTVEGPPSVP